jgi:predicted nucleic acid-binding protein
VIVVDSSIWISHFRDVDSPEVRALRTIAETRHIVVGDLILLEVLQGAKNDLHAARLENYLSRFRVERMLDDGLAVKAARNYRILRSRGSTIRTTIDLIVATFCIENEYALLHDDRDYAPMIAHLGLRTM